MWNKPTENQLSKLPVLYSTESVPLMEKVIHIHFFLAGCDWYVAEYDKESQNFFGFVILNNDYLMAEWGYFNFNELCELKVQFVEVDRDIHFTQAKAKCIDNIRKAESEVT
jgi:hypothetical protein